MLTEKQLETFAKRRSRIALLTIGILGTFWYVRFLRPGEPMMSICAWGISLAALELYILTTVQAFRSRSWLCGIATAAFLASQWVFEQRFFWESGYYIIHLTDSQAPQVSTLQQTLVRSFTSPITISLVLLLFVILSNEYVLWKNRKSGTLPVPDPRPTLDAGRLQRFVRTYHLMVSCLMVFLFLLVLNLGLEIGDDICRGARWIWAVENWLSLFMVCAGFAWFLPLFVLLVRGQCWNPLFKAAALLGACVLLGSAGSNGGYNDYFPGSWLNTYFYNDYWFRYFAQIVLLALIPAALGDVFERHAMRFQLWISRENEANAALLQGPVFPVQSPEWLRSFLADYRAFLIFLGISLLILWATCLCNLLNLGKNLSYFQPWIFYVCAIFLSDLYALRMALKPGVPGRCRVLTGVFIVGSLVPFMNFVLFFWFLNLFCYDVFRAHGITPTLWIPQEKKTVEGEK